VRIAPIPSWVKQYPIPDCSGGYDDYVEGGLCQLLRDIQVDTASPQRHVHIAHKVLTREGAERIAQFRIEFDPSYHEFELHFVRVVRGADVNDYARSESVDVLRREQNLERRVLDGRLTASLIIPDVRPGDIVESAWTIRGENPALGNRFFDWVAFAGPSLSVHYRLRSAAERAIRAKAFGGGPKEQVRQDGDFLDRTWTVERAPKFQPEQLAPSWQVLAPSVQFSETESWSDVGRLFAHYYDCERLPQPLVQQLAEIAKRQPAETQICEILRLVQDRVRYLALSIGEGSLVPRSISEIWSTGYGDCKDAVRLFVALARSLKHDAAPALIATGYGPVLDSFLPSATVFDHCIARVKIENRIYWLDPTLRAQGCGLEGMHTPYFGYALPLSDGAEIENIPVRAPELLLDVDERVEFGPKVDSPATFQFKCHYRSISADRTRTQIANEGLPSFSRKMVSRYERIWPGIQPDGEMTCEESQGENHITLIAKYRIPDPWKRLADDRVKFEIADHTVSPALAGLAPAPRKTDIHLGIPRKFRRRLKLAMPKVWTGGPQDKIREIADTVRYRSVLTIMGAAVEQDKELVITNATAPAGSATSYSELVNLMLQDETLILSSKVSGNKFVQAKKSGTNLIWIFWIIAIVLYVVAQAASLSH
jgi:transglutaminase-like putative cysteine protease